MEMSNIAKEDDNKNSFYEITEEEDISQFTVSEDRELDFDNLGSFLVEKPTKIFEEEKPYKFEEGTNRTDVYIKNYLMKF